MAAGWNRTGEAGLRIRAPRDFWGGLVLVALALFALWAARDLTGIQGFQFGPGTAPRLLAGLLLAVGVLVTLSGLALDGPPIGGYAFTGPFFVILAIIAFALMIRGMSYDIGGLHFTTPPFGLVPSTFAAFVIAILGSSEMRWGESLAAAVVMTAFCVGLFVYLLRLPFDLWPPFLAPYLAPYLGQF